MFPLVVVLSIALVAAIGLAFWQYQEAQASGLAVRTGRERAYYSALDALTSLEADLSKALIASAPGQHALLLGRVSTLAATASENLSALPAAYGADASGLKFLNQTSDYAQTLAAAAAEGRTLTQDDVNQLSELLEKGGELRRHLESGAGFTYDETAAGENLSGIEYPTLLYDGPSQTASARARPAASPGRRSPPNRPSSSLRTFLEPPIRSAPPTCRAPSPAGGFRRSWRTSPLRFN